MAITHTLSLNWTGSGGSSSLLNTVALTGQEEQNFSLTVTSGAVDQSIGMTFAYSKLIEQYIVCDQTATIYVNSTHGGSPSLTIPLQANQPFVYYVGNGATTSPYGTTSVTQAFVSYGTTAVSTTANLNIRTLLTSP